METRSSAMEYKGSYEVDKKKSFLLMCQQIY